MCLRDKRLPKDPAFKKELLVLLAVCAVLTAAGFLWRPAAGVSAAVCCLIFILLYLFFGVRRAEQLSSLSDRIGDALSGGGVGFASYREGELSVLESELTKLLLSYRQQNDALKGEKEFLSDSLTDISHQLRTPLTSVNLLLSLLSQPEVSDEKRLELTERLNALSGDIDRRIDLLLKTAELDAGAVRFECNEVSVSECIARALEPLTVALEVKNITLCAELRDEHFPGDEKKTAEAFSNLLKNCIEHTGEGGTVTVRSTETPIYTSVTIGDSGEGFREEDIPHLFERFYKGKNATEQSKGIGLSYAAAVIAGQNGTVKAYNSETGANFEVRFYRQTV